MMMVLVFILFPIWLGHICDQDAKVHETIYRVNKMDEERKQQAEKEK